MVLQIVSSADCEKVMGLYHSALMKESVALVFLLLRQKRPSHSTPRQSLVNQDALQGNFYFKSAKLTQCWFNFAVSWRRKHVAAMNFFKNLDHHHVAEIVVKMKNCTFLESNFLLASCKFVDDLQMRTPADHGSR